MPQVVGYLLVVEGGSTVVLAVAPANESLVINVHALSVTRTCVSWSEHGAAGNRGETCFT